MSGRPHLAPEARRLVGEAVRELRQAGVCWKTLERRFDRDRRHLRRLAEAASPGAAGEMSQQSGQMSHPGAGEERAAR